MENLPLGRIAALVPKSAVKDLPLGRTHDDDDDDVFVCEYKFMSGNIYIMSEV